MAEQFQRVEPTPFTAPGAGAAAPQQATRGSRAWLLPALIALALLAAAVVFLLPQFVARGPDGPPALPESQRASAPPRPAAGAGTQPEAGEPATPFADAVEAKARSAAQDLLAELLDVQDNLLNRGAESWAGDDMAAIAALAAAGDERYRERDFEAALTQYEAALDSALALEQSIPERFEEVTAALVAQVEALDVDAARSSLALAERLAPGDPSLQALAGRVEALPEVAAAVATATGAEAAGDLAAAVSALEEAATLDPAHAQVAAELARVGAAWTRERFNTAMSEGYLALEAGNFERAQARFEAAARLRPGAGETSAALNELSVARTAATLRALKASGERLLEEESWQQAIDTFEEALAIDSTLSFARRGLAFARPRAALSAELDAILDDPGRLVDDAVLREAEASLTRARELGDPGPQLAQQIDAVARVLATASTPVAVTLRSDGQTSVVVYKVARLGQFEEQRLSLRPGTYTAVGTRRGFRDVREEFTVTPGGLAAPVVIACRDAI